MLSVKQLSYIVQDIEAKRRYSFVVVGVLLQTIGRGRSMTLRTHTFDLQQTPEHSYRQLTVRIRGK